MLYKLYIDVRLSVLSSSEKPNRIGQRTKHFVERTSRLRRTGSHAETQMLIKQYQQRQPHDWICVDRRSNARSDLSYGLVPKPKCNAHYPLLTEFARLALTQMCMDDRKSACTRMVIISQIKAFSFVIFLLLYEYMK